jgi:hypothetical protein
MKGWIPRRADSYKIYKVLGARLLSPFMPVALASAKRRSASASSGDTLVEASARLTEERMEQSSR